MSKQTWTITNHICRFCFGRILQSENGDSIRCSDCGQTLTNSKVRSLCSCGTKLKNGKNAGFQCVANVDHTPGINQEIVTEHNGE